MLLDDFSLIKGDEDMADKKDNKPAEDDSPFNSSGELFETLFREELDTLTNGQKEEAAPKTDKKASVAKRPKSSSQVKRVTPGKPVPQTDAKAKKIPRQKPLSRVHVDRPQRASTKPAANTSEVPETKPVSADKGDAPAKAKPKKSEKFGKIKRRSIGSQPKLGGGGSDKIKIAVLCVILVAAVAFIVNALGIVDFGGLLGLSEPTKKERIPPRVAKKPPAKTNQKRTRVPIKPPQKSTSPQSAKKLTTQKKTLIVKKPTQVAPSKAQPLTVKRSAKPTTTAKKPVITQQLYRPATPPKKPPAVQQPPKPPAPKPRPVVVMKPSQPSPSTQKPVVAKKSPKPATSTQRPVVAKKPQPVVTLKPPPVVKEPVRPAAQSQKKPILGKEELFPEESSLSYPYSIYLGAYKTPERAERAISMYRNKGLSAYWVKVDLGDKGVWYRVFTGYFRDQKQAEAFIKRKRLEDARAKRTKYATLIGIYATERDAQKKFLALSRLGYSPYVIETNRGESQLYVGAFYTKIGAEVQRSDLASKGVQSQVVER
jgi:cell division septation protein DedD